MTVTQTKNAIKIDTSAHPAERGPTMNSANGQKMFPFDPKPEEIHIEVIAHHLACNCRWNGATQHQTFRSRIFFSVAEHSVLVAKFVKEELKRPDLELEALLHDAPEYLLSDMIRPIKYSPEILPIYKAHEDRAEEVISKRFGLLFPLPKEVKQADEAVCAAEFRQIVPHDENDPSPMLHDDTVVAPYQLEMMDPYRAKEAFMLAYESAMRRRHLYINNPPATLSC